MLLISRLEDNEAFIITGALQFSEYSGYGFRWKYEGDYLEQEDLEIVKTKKLIGIDAVVNIRGGMQWSSKSVLRDISKCAIGLMKEKGVFATSNWGCGAFGGDKGLKAFQQILACAIAQVDIEYCCFGDNNIAEDITKFYQEFKESTVKDLWKVYESTLKTNGEYIPKNKLLELMIKEKELMKMRKESLIDAF